MQDGLLFVFAAGQSQSNIADALATIVLSESDRAQVPTLLREALGVKESNEFKVKSVVTIRAAQKELRDDEINLMIDGFPSKAGYEISRALENVALKQPQIDHANSLLR